MSLCLNTAYWSYTGINFSLTMVRLACVNGAYITAVARGQSLRMFTFTPWGVYEGRWLCHLRVCEAINLIFAWEILELGPCPLIMSDEDMF